MKYLPCVPFDEATGTESKWVEHVCACTGNLCACAKTHIRVNDRFSWNCYVDMKLYVVLN